MRSSAKPHMGCFHTGHPSPTLPAPIQATLARKRCLLRTLARPMSVRRGPVRARP